MLLFFITLLFFLATATGYPVRCDDSTWAIFSNSSRGLEVQVDKISENLTSGSTEVIDSYYLPPECLLDHESCNLVEVGGNWLTFPAANSNLVFVNLKSLDQWQVHPVTHDCNPTNLFFDQDVLWVGCKRSTNTSSRLSYLPYSISTTSELSITELFDPSSVVDHVASSFSRSILIRHPSCFSHGESNLYTVADDGYVWHYPATFGVDMVFTRSQEPLENCSSIAYIDVSDRTTFTVHCSGGVAATYNACLGRWQYHYLNVNGLYFSCSSSLVDVFYKNDSVRVAYSNGTTIWQQNHSVGGILRGKCNSDFFNVVAVNGSLFSFVVSSGSFYLISQNVCDNMSCLWPTFNLATSQFIGIDGNSANIFLVSKAEECSSPVKEVRDNNIPRPAMIHLISSPDTGLHSCQCTGSSTSGSESATTASSTQDTTSDIQVHFPARAVSTSTIVGIVVPIAFMVVVGLIAAFVISMLLQQ